MPVKVDIPFLKNRPENLQPIELRYVVLRTLLVLTSTKTFLFLCLIPGGRHLIMPNNLLGIDTIYIWIILFAIIWLLPSILLTYFSVEVLDPGRINILLAFEVAVGFLSSALLTNEIIGFREYIGAIFVVSACFVDVAIWKKFNAYFSK